ncbi:hypothetical protein EV183_004890 [Coemansia sp. RSA 2336]|nr:hypothetical protein EV183_004890 [Coemansia sp. RSA 2336]
MKSFCTIGAIAAVLAGTSSGRFVGPEEIDHNVSQVRSQRQAQCGHLRPGSLEYNQCMAHWTDRVLDCYPEDQHLDPRQEVERMNEANRADTFRSEVNRLAMPQMEHYVAGGNQRNAVVRHRTFNDERATTPNARPESEIVMPEEDADMVMAEQRQPQQIQHVQSQPEHQLKQSQRQPQQQAQPEQQMQHVQTQPEQQAQPEQKPQQPEQQQQEAPVRKGRIIRTTLTGKQAPIRQATPVITPVAATTPAEAPAAPAASPVTTGTAMPAAVTVVQPQQQQLQQTQKVVQAQSPQRAVQAQEESDEEEESDVPAIAQTIVQPNVVVSASDVSAASSATVAPVSAQANTTVAAVSSSTAATADQEAKQLTEAVSAVASAAEKPATEIASAATSAVDSATSAIVNAVPVAAQNAQFVTVTATATAAATVQPSLAAIVAAQNGSPQHVKIVTKVVAAATAEPTIINNVQSVKMTTVGHAVVPFDVNLFGTDGAPFIGLASEEATSAVAAAEAAAPESPAAQSPGVAVVTETAAPATAAATESEAAAARETAISGTPAAETVSAETQAAASAAASAESVTFNAETATVARSASETNSTVPAATVTAIVSPETSAATLLADAATEFKPRPSVLQVLQDTNVKASATPAATAKPTANAGFGVVDAKQAASKIARANMKNKVETSGSAKFTVSAAAVVLPVIANFVALSLASTCAIAASSAADATPAQPVRCALAEQVRLCVNHASMQRATCSGDDLDCQCTWASKATTCFAPCISDKEFSDGMHVAHGDQDTICSQAAKFGKIAKDKEKQKQDEKKGIKKVESSVSPKSINDLNSLHDGPTASADSKRATNAPELRGESVDKAHAPRASNNGHGKNAIKSSKSQQGSVGTKDKDLNMADSGAAGMNPNLTGFLLAFLGTVAALAN